VLERILTFSISHRYLVVMLTIVVACVGAFCLTRLSIDAVPDITNKQVQINTPFPSMSPAEVEEQITFPIETTLAGTPGIEYTRSLSRNGFSQVTAVFRDSVDIYFARQLLSQRISEAKESLPAGAEPTMGATATALDEVYMWTVEYVHPHGRGAEIRDEQPGWQSDGSYLTPEGERLRTDVELETYLRTVQDWIIKPQLKGLDGVADIDAIGGYEKQFHVLADPKKLYSYGLTFLDVIDAIERNNVSTGAGFIERNGESYVVRATGRIGAVSEITNIAITTRQGEPIRIGDVATVAIGGDLRMGSGSKDGNEVVIGTAMKLIGANGRTVAKAVDDRIARVNKALPPDIEARTVLNRTRLIDATISTVRNNLTEGALLVVVVLLVLLGSIRTALIVALAIPLSMLMMAVGMVQMDVSGNLMSLGAIDFGLIVDGAVIIVENCLRRLSEKQHALGRVLELDERLKEVKAAAQEVIRPSVFGQAIIVTVYIPVLALTGVEGKMFRPMATTVIFALSAAFALSITFIPAMVAIFIGRKVRETESVFIRVAKYAYEPALRVVLRYRYAVVLAGMAAFVGALMLFGTLGQEFVPRLDEQDFLIIAARIPSTGISQSTAMQLDVEKALKQFPEVEVVFSKTGTADMAADPLPPNEADMFVMLKPRSARPDPHEPKEHLRARMEEVLTKLPGNSYEYTQPIEDRVNEMLAGVRTDIAVRVFGDRFDEMLPVSQAIVRTLQKVSGAADVKADQVEGLPTMRIDMDRDALSRYGLSVADVQDVVAIAVGGREAGLVFEGDRRFDIIVRLPDTMREDLPSIENLPIPVPSKGDEAPPAAAPDAGNRGPSTLRYVPLASVAHVTLTEGLNEVSRENGKRRISVQANVRGRDIASFAAEAQQAIDRDVTLPPGTWLDWGGQFKNLVVARRRLAVVVPLCFFLIFILLFSTFNSAKYALLVFTGVPLGLTGGIVALWLRNMPFSITAAVGFIALSGVAVLNGLVMLTFINQLRAEGVGLDEAIVRGSLTRLRPVLITALVASLGFVPMALATGTGAEVQRPLATVVIGGLISSTALKVVVLPALYRIFESGKADSLR
jgi:cobalt-zinc-cadmium resistance protein CzcA